MSNFNFLNRIERGFHHGRKKSLGFGSGPYEDWKIISYVFGFFTLIVVLICVMVFIKIDKGEIFRIERAEIEQEKLLNVDLLKEAISYYRAKEVEFERILNSVSSNQVLPPGIEPRITP
jgi:uncharacterized membrane protein